MVKKRYLTARVTEDLHAKMVFVAGPRQVGKTTLSTELVAAQFKSFAYFSWDRKVDRTRITASDWPADAELLIFDELHKYRPWKRLLKGEYDALKKRYAFLVTGSSRLDVYRRGGDSLQGRYHSYRMHPFSLGEMRGVNGPIPVPFKEIACETKSLPVEFKMLETFGGFPEPLLRQETRTLRRWHAERNERLFREDIRDLEIIKDLGSLQLLGDMLPARVGSLLSVNALREDLQVSHKSVVRWLRILESFYYAYRLYPFAKGRFRSLKKEPKLYLWDWSEISDAGARFENVIACHLLKTVHFLKDSEGYKAELYFLRETAGREVDFLVTIDGKPWFAVEAKVSDTQIDPSLRYFGERLDIPFSFQVIQTTGVDRLIQGVRLISADKFLTGLP